MEFVLKCPLPSVLLGPLRPLPLFYSPPLSNSSLLTFIKPFLLFIDWDFLPQRSYFISAVKAVSPATTK
jgi:hypothetical protein